MTDIPIPRELVERALRRAYSLGQTYWQQADSEYASQQRKSDETAAKFQQLVADTLAALRGTLEPALSQPHTERAEAVAWSAKMLSNLLARIHRDGGHHEADNGTEPSVRAADAKICAWLARDDATPPSPSEEPARVRLREFERSQKLAEERDALLAGVDKLPGIPVLRFDNEDIAAIEHTAPTQAQAEPTTPAKIGGDNGHPCSSVTYHRGGNYVCQRAGHGVGKDSCCKECPNAPAQPAQAAAPTWPMEQQPDGSVTAVDVDVWDERTQTVVGTAQVAITGGHHHG